MKERAAAPPDAGEHHRQADRGGALRVHVAHRRQGGARRRREAHRHVRPSAGRSSRPRSPGLSSTSGRGSTRSRSVRSRRTRRRGRRCPSGVTAGNLAALEDDERRSSVVAAHAAAAFDAPAGSWRPPAASSSAPPSGVPGRRPPSPAQRRRTDPGSGSSSRSWSSWPPARPPGSRTSSRTRETRRSASGASRGSCRGLPGGSWSSGAVLAACASRGGPARDRCLRRRRVPTEMALVAGRFCIDRWEASLVEIGPQGELPFSPYTTPQGKAVRAVSREGVVPQGYVSRDQATRACAASRQAALPRGRVGDGVPRRDAARVPVRRRAAEGRLQRLGRSRRCACSIATRPTRTAAGP